MPDIVRWDPFRDLSALRDDINRFWSGTLMRWPETRWGAPGAWATWQPPVDIYETDDDVVMTVELPGLTRDEVEVTVDRNSVTISGESKVEEDITEDRFHRRERRYGRFTRRFSLPTEVESTRAGANFTNGVLRVTMPKTEESRRRPVKVPVQEAASPPPIAPQHGPETGGRTRVQ